MIKAVDTNYVVKLIELTKAFKQSNTRARPSHGVSTGLTTFAQKN